MDNVKQVLNDIKNFKENVFKTSTLIFRKIAIDLDQMVVLMTPVDTGRARGNWFPSINVPATGYDNEKTDRSGSEAYTNILMNANKATIGHTIWMTNNLPYILALENGHSNQAPAGMVQVSINAIAAQYGGKII